MRKSLILCLTTACVMAPALQARSFDEVVEPAMMMKLEFGGSSRSEFGVGLRLNYSTAVRRALATLSVSPESSIEAFESGIGSRLLETPALAQLDFNRHGFRKASLIGLPLVTRHVRVNQTDEAAGEEVPAEEGMAEEGMAEEAVAEEAAWYDFKEWGWKGWSLAAAGAVGVYLLAEGGSDDTAPAGGGSAGVPCDIPPIGPIPGEPEGCNPDL